LVFDAVVWGHKSNLRHVTAYNGDDGNALIFMERGSCWPWTNRTYVCSVGCSNLKVLYIVFDTVYGVVSSRSFAILLSKYTTMVMMTLRRTFVTWMYACMQRRCRVGSAQSACTLVCLYCCAFKFEVFDTVWVLNNLTFMYVLSKYTTMVMATLSALILWNGVVSAMDEQDVRALVWLHAWIWRCCSWCLMR